MAEQPPTRSKIAKIIALAEHPTTPPTVRAMAEQKLAEYRPKYPHLFNQRQNPWTPYATFDAWRAARTRSWSQPTDAEAARSRARQQQSKPSSKPKPKPRDDAWKLWTPGLSQKITVLVDSNPKTREAAQRFALYSNGQTVIQYVVAVNRKFHRTEGEILNDIRWDRANGFIRVD
jgi:hypothetical protein